MTTTAQQAAYEAIIARAQAEYDTFAQVLATPGLRCGGSYQTGAGIPLAIATIGYPADATEDDVIARRAVGNVHWLSEDGRGWEATWAEGTGDDVYVERWNDGRRTFHGWVDRTSRRITQAG